MDIRSRTGEPADEPWGGSGWNIGEPPEGPWGGRQPKFDKLVMRDAQTFVLKGRLPPSGEPVTVQLGRFQADAPWVWYSPPQK